MAKLTSKPAHTYGVLALFMLVHGAAATEFKIGGGNGWTLPPDPNFNPYNQWAEMHRFQIGDSVLFMYPPDKDSVLQVTQEKYDKCIVDDPIASFKDGNTLVTFNQSGPHYFISGTNGNCLKNEKIALIVMAERGSVNRSIVSNNTNTTAPVPAPVQSPPQVVTPSTPPEMNPSTPPGMVPAIAPAGEASPSPPSPPSGNGASSLLMTSSVASLVGGLFGTSLLLAL